MCIFCPTDAAYGGKAIPIPPISPGLTSMNVFSFDGSNIANVLTLPKSTVVSDANSLNGLPFMYTLHTLTTVLPIFLKSIDIKK